MPEVPHSSATAVEHGEVVAERQKERIYATLTMVAVVLGLAQSHTISSSEAAVSVAAASLSLWLATVVADQQAHRIVHRGLARGRALRRMLYVSSPLLVSAVGPLILIAASGLGAMQLHTALLGSAAASLVTLFAFGCIGSLQLGAGMLGAVVVGLADTSIGWGVVGVKLLAGH